MINIAKLPDDERCDLFGNTADKMGLSDAIVEKDFWVCFLLDYLFHMSRGMHDQTQSRMRSTKRSMFDPENFL